MKTALLGVAAVILVTVSSAQLRAEGNLVTTKISVAGCSQPVVLTLRARSSNESIDPDEFNEIAFKVGSQAFRFKTTTPQFRLKPSPVNPPDDFSKVQGVSVDPTGYFLWGQYPSKEGERSLLLFVGQTSGGGSDPESLLVFGFHSDCTPYQVFQSGTFELNSFEANSLGGSLLIGKSSLSQILAGSDWQNGKPYATTYDPYSVYHINSLDEGKATYSLEESESYNRIHYCWAGPHMSEAKAVVYNRLRKNSMECMSASRARNLIH